MPLLRCNRLADAPPSISTQQSGDISRRGHAQSQDAFVLKCGRSSLESHEPAAAPNGSTDCIHDSNKFNDTGRPPRSQDVVTLGFMTCPFAVSKRCTGRDWTYGCTLCIRRTSAFAAPLHSEPVDSRSPVPARANTWTTECCRPRVAAPSLPYCGDEDERLLCVQHCG